MHNEVGQLVERARAGDERAFEKLYSSYYDPIFRYILVRTSDTEVAEDITQITFIKFFKHLDKWQDMGHGVKAYLYQIARNAVIDHYRTQKAQKHDKSEEILATIADDAAGLQEIYEIKQRDQALIAQLDILPDLAREVVVLRFIEGLDSKTVGEIIGKSDVAVRKITSRAIAQLRLHIEGKSL